MAKVVSLRIALTDEASANAKQIASALKETASAYGEVTKAQVANEGAGQNQVTLLDRIRNRILQGIPTMLALMTMYKAMRGAIDLVTGGLQELDDQLVGQQSIALALQTFGKWTDSAGKAASATEAWGKSLALASAYMEVFQAQAKLTNVTADDMRNTFSDMLMKGLPKGVDPAMLLQIEAGFAQLATSAEDFKKRMAEFDQFFRNPRITNPIVAFLGMNRDAVTELRKNGGDMVATATEVLARLDALTKSVNITQNMKGSWAQIGQSFRDEMAKSMEEAAPEFRKYLQLFVIMADQFAHVIGESLLGLLKSLAPMIIGVAFGFAELINVVNLVSIAFDVAAAAVWSFIAGITYIGMQANKGLALGLGAVGIKVPQLEDGGASLVATYDMASKKAQGYTKDVDAAVQRTEDLSAAMRKLETAFKNPDAFIQTAKERLALAAADAAAIAKGAQTGLHPDNVIPPNTAALQKEMDAFSNTLDRVQEKNALAKAFEVASQEFAKLAKLEAAGAPGDWAQAQADKITTQYQNAYDKATAISLSAFQALDRIGAEITTGLLGKETDAYALAIAKIDQQYDAIVAKINTTLKTTTSGGDPALQAELDAEARRQLDFAAASAAYAKDFAARTRDAATALHDAGDASATFGLIIEKALRDHKSVTDELLKQKQLLDESKTAADGLFLGAVQAVANVKTVAQSVYDLITSLDQALTAGLKNSIAAMMTGDTQGIKDAFKNLFKAITDALAQYLTDSIKRSILDAFGGSGDSKNNIVQSMFEGIFGKGGIGALPQLPQGSGSLASVQAGGISNTMPVTGGSNAGSGGVDYAKLAAGVMMAYSTLQNASNGNTSILGSAVSGAVAGGTIGSVYPVIGTVVGAIIGAVIGAVAALMAPAAEKGLAQFAFKNGTAYVGTGGSLSGSDMRDALRQQAQTAYDAVQKSWLDVMLTLPKSIFDKVMAVPIKPLDFSTYNNPDDKSAANIRTVNSKDSSTFTQLFLSTQLPAAIIQSYMPAIAEIFKGFGLDAQKISDLQTRWTALGSAALPEIQAFALALTSLGTTAQKVNANDALATAFANQTKTFGQALLDNIEPLSRMTTLLNDPNTSLANQLVLVGKISDAMNTVHGQFLDFMNKLADAMKAAHDSIGTQIFGIQLDQTKSSTGAATQATYDMLMSRIAFYEKQLGAASTPEQVTSITGQIQQLLGQVYQIDPAKYANLVIGELKKLDQYSQARYKELGQIATDAYNQMVEIVRSGMAAFVTAGGGVLPPDLQPTVAGLGRMTPVVAPKSHDLPHVGGPGPTVMDPALATAITTLTDTLTPANFAAAIATAQANQSKSYGETIAPNAAVFKGLFAISGDSLATIGKIQTTMDGITTGFLAFMDKLAASMKATSESIQQDIFNIQLAGTRDSAGKPTQATVDALFARLNFYDAQLRNAKTPEEIAAITSQEQGIINQIYQLDPAQYAQWALAQLAKLDTYARTAYEKVGSAATNAYNQMVELVRAGMAAFVAAATAVAGPGRGTTPVVRGRVPAPDASGACPAGWHPSADGKTCVADAVVTNRGRPAASGVPDYVNQTAAASPAGASTLDVNITVDGNLADHATVTAVMTPAAPPRNDLSRVRRLGPSVFDNPVG